VLKQKIAKNSLTGVQETYSSFNRNVIKSVQLEFLSIVSFIKRPHIVKDKLLARLNVDLRTVRSSFHLTTARLVHRLLTVD
jgi:hypothetical protein